MALQLGALRDALESAQGVTPDQARKASEEVAAYETRFARVDADLTLLKWMVGACGAGIIALIVGMAQLLIRTSAALTG